MIRPVLELRSVRRVFGEGHGAVVAVDEVTESFSAGSFHAVVGRSGSGKSTLLHLCAGLDRPTSGTVLVAGQDLASLDDAALARLRRTTVGVVFQSFNLMPSLSVEENALLPLLLERAPGAGDRVRLDRLLERLDLSPRRAHRPEHLSGGERQRAAIARALLLQPQILLADEPTGSLDTASGAAVGDLLASLAREDGVCVVAVTHDLALAARADRVVHLEDGRIVRREIHAAGSSIA